MNTQPKTVLDLSISPMMPFRRICLIMGSIKKEINFHMKNLKDICKDNIEEGIVSSKLSTHKWKKLHKIQWEHHQWS